MLKSNPWRCIYFDEETHTATNIMSVPGGVLVLVQWFPDIGIKERPATSTMEFVACSDEDFINLHQMAMP